MDTLNKLVQPYGVGSARGIDTCASLLLNSSTRELTSPRELTVTRNIPWSTHLSIGVVISAVVRF